MNIEEQLQKINDLRRESSLPVKPNSFGKDYKFPEDLTTLSGEDLGGILSRLGAYRGYCQRQLGISEIQREMYKDLLNLELPNLMAQIDRKGKTKTDVREEARALPDAVVIREKISEIDYMFRFYYYLAMIYSGQIEVVSREITRRKGI